MNDSSEMRVRVFLPRDATTAEFVKFWSDQYAYDNEDVYDQRIRERPLSPEGVVALFTWNNGGPMSGRKHESVQANYVARIAEVTSLPANIGVKDFLALFKDGGAIWRIFWMHCNYPEHCPIFDQHVYRAMTHIVEGAAKELNGMSDRRKIELYIDEYIPFYLRFAGMNPRAVDKALWAYGRFLKRLKSPDALTDRP